MPLFTDQIGAARVAYDFLEKRAISAESRASRLAAALSAARDETASVALLRQRIADLEGQAIELSRKLDDLQRARTDAGLQQFIEAMALSAALGEASMPGRSIKSLSASVRAHMTPVSGGVALRFHPPELGAANVGAIGTTHFTIAKVPPPAAATAPGNFYGLLLQTQMVFAAVSAPNASDLVTGIVVAASRAIADAGSWNFAYLAGVAANLAQLQMQFAATDKRPEARVLSDHCRALAALATSLSVKPNPVAGDLFALTAAFSETASAAASLAGLFAP